VGERLDVETSKLVLKEKEKRKTNIMCCNKNIYALSNIPQDHAPFWKNKIQ